MNISLPQLAALKAHLAEYELGAVAALLNETTAADATGSVDIGSTFLNAAGQLQAQLLKQAGNPDFVFWIAASTEPQPLAAYLPQMLPYAPAGVVDAEAFPFPQLGAVTLSEPQWQYVYISDQSQWAALVPSPLAKTLGMKPDGTADWHGGLCYSGKYVVPFAELLPEGAAWLAAPAAALAGDGIVVTGYLDYRSPTALPDLKLRIPLAEKSFSEGLIKKLALVLELASPVYYLDGGPPALGRRIGLLGTLSLQHSDLTVTGTWPLDDDQVLLGIRCNLHEVSDWLGTGFMRDIPLPQDATASLQLVIDKRTGTLEKVSFDLVLATWDIPGAAFALSDVRFAVSTAYPTSLGITLASFEAIATLGTGAGAVALRCTGTYPDKDFYLGLVPPLNLQKFITAAGGPDLAFLPAGLAITELSGHYNASRGYKAFVLAIGLVNPASSTAGEYNFTLDNIRLDMYGPYAYGYIFKLSAAFTFAYTASGVSKNLAFAGVAEYAGGWLLSLRYTGQLTLDELVTAFGLGNAPTELNGFVFTELSLILNSRTTKDGGWQYSFQGRFKFPNLFGLTDITVDLLVEKTTDGTQFTGSFNAEFGGKPVALNLEAHGGANSRAALKLAFPISGVPVYLTAASTTTAGSSAAEKLTEKTFAGGTQGLHLPVSDLLRELMGDDYLPLPTALLPALVLEDVYLNYTNNELNFTALVLVDGKEITFFLQRKLVAGQAQFAYGITTEFDGLSGLPVVGNELTNVQLLNVGFVHVASDGPLRRMVLSGKENQHRTLLPLPVSDETYKAGFNLTGKLKLPTGEQRLELPLPISPASSLPADLVVPGSPAVPATIATPAAPVVASSAAAKWFELDKQLGPVHLASVGLAYSDEKLYLLVSLDLNLAGLVFSLSGLGVGFNPRELLAGTLTTPDFKLSGLGLSFESGGVNLSASFLRSQQLIKSEQVDVYNGGAIIKFEEITITGIGSYANYHGQSSLFVYALYVGVLGGPPFFVVTGLAVGFGYNRRVNVPTYDAVARFPLVTMAIQPASGRKLSEILAELETPDEKTGQLPIEIASGEYWLAVGVKFTSFEVVQGYLLLIAGFGQRPQFAVLGVANMTLPLPPPTGGPAPAPFVYLEMQMAAVLVPSEGYFSVAGSLTSSSFVLARECHLTGGFAYSMWFDSPDPNKKGQFVLTVGGYHPAFKAPAFYPQVPRLGYVWQVSDSVSIKGESYFAVTPACGMVGTSLEVLFDAGDLKAWFIARADMLVTWHPLSFLAEIYVEIGASVRLNLLFCHKTVTVSISGNLTLWGPPLGGRVSVHVIIVTLTISFGVDQPDNENHKPLSWDRFRQLLPAADKVCAIVATSGLTQAVKNPATNVDTWVVRGGRFGFSVQSAVPASRIVYANVPAPANQVLAAGPMNIRPMFAAGVDSTLTLTLQERVTQKDEHGRDSYTWQPRNWTEVFGQNAATPLTGSMAAALWGTLLSDDSGGYLQAPDSPSSEVVANQLLGCRVQAPSPTSSPMLGPIDLKELANEEVASGDLAFHCPPDPTLPDYWQDIVADGAARPIVKASTRRAKLWDVLTQAALCTGTVDDLTELVADYDNLFRARPRQYSGPAH